MRILHFMNIALSVADVKSAGKGISASGGWMAALLSRMVRDTNHTFACVAFGGVKEVQVSHDDRIDSFIVPGDLAGRSLDRTLRRYCDLVSQWKPDLIHIHGTEAVYGLLSARNMVTCPAMISLQGLLGPYSEWYRYFGNSSLLEIIRMHRWLRFPRARPMEKVPGDPKTAKREREIIAGNRFFMGRTAWDRAYVRALNPSSKYFHGGELLRDAFWQDRWSMDQAQQYRIIFTNAGGYPRKGTENLLDAVKLLQPCYPDIQLCIAGGISRQERLWQVCSRPDRRTG